MQFNRDISGDIGRDTRTSGARTAAARRTGSARVSPTARISPGARLTGTALVLSLALLTGCSGGGSDDGDDSGKGDGGAQRTTGPGGDATAGAAAYDGPRLPGFAAKPAWSLAADGDKAPGVLDLGGTLLFAKDASGAYLTDFDDTDAFKDPEAWGDNGYDEPAPQGPNRVLHLSEAPQPLTLEFRDTKTGEVRKSLRTKADLLALTTWNDGIPAVAVGTSGTTGSDGLTAERTTSTATLYDGDARELGRTALPHPEEGRYYTAALTGGYRVETAGHTLRLTPVHDGATRTVSCTEAEATCEYDPRTGLMSAARATAPPVLGRYYAGFENASVSGPDMVRITLSDLVTGKKVWSSADAEIPPGVTLYDDGEPDTEPMPESETVSLLRVTDGKVLLAWQASKSAEDAWIHAWYDLRSGALTDSYEATRSVLYAPSDDLAAEDAVPGDTFTGTTVWRLPAGKRLWAQEEGSGETPLDPVGFTADGSVLYGLTTAENGTETGLAVDPRTREVLAKDLPADHVPTVDVPTGYGHITTADGFFAFAPTAS
ncbi:hypothetical protein [Streptomyces ipomoeae]|uniref:hypothetical protein n=1 Tax=Streptomyces ipomoeae TaxID=103232 RepID=UPI0011469D82|nr:hypothetical protein [Streptomyces ipomoeae]TQE40504.1 hypothetical protein Sipo7851_00325 [Streptomyces ipomoeae]